MNQIKKIFYWTGVVFIGFWLIMPILRLVMDIEFATVSIKSSYKKFLFFAVPIAIILTLFGTEKNKNKTSKIAIKIIGRIIAIGISVFIMIMSLFIDMCIWTNKEILYVKKNDSNTKIIVREFGCGATDSGPPRVEIYKVKQFTNYFIRCTKIDSSKIDEKEWVKVK